MTYFLIATYLPQVLHESGRECLLGFVKFLDSYFKIHSSTYRGYIKDIHRAFFS